MGAEPRATESGKLNLPAIETEVKKIIQTSHIKEEHHKCAPEEFEIVRF